jgi:hypothetical protein
MSKKSTVTKGTKRGGKVSMSDRLRSGLHRLGLHYDLNVVSTEQIVTTSRNLIRAATKKETKVLREAFNPTAVQVSIVKREFTGGSPTGKRGRPSHASIGLVDEAA